MRRAPECLFAARLQAALRRPRAPAAKLSHDEDLSLIIAGVVGVGLFIKSGRTLPPRINQ